MLNTSSYPNHSTNFAVNATISSHTDPEADNTWYWILRGIIGLLIISGNGLIIYLIASRRSLHNTTNWLTLSLAVADFLIGIVVVPSSYFCAFKVVRRCNINIMYILNLGFLFVSVSNLCAITIDRFVAVRIPYKYHLLKSPRNRRWMIVLSWAIPGIISCVPLTWQHMPVDAQAKFEQGFYTFQILVSTIIPCLAMSVAYALIYHATWRQSYAIAAHSQLDLARSRKVQECRRLRRAGQASIRVYGLIVLLFVVCWSLSAYRYIIDIFNYPPTSNLLVYISRLLILLNSAANPVVYTFLKRDIRAELKASIRNLTGWDINAEEPVSVTIPEPSSRHRSTLVLA